MRRLFIGLVLAAMALLLVPLPASAAEPEYETFVACEEFAEVLVPSHECQLDEFPGAFFESSVDTELKVCIEFPDAFVECTEEEPVEGEVLYVVPIPAELEGDHLITWYVEGTEIDSWALRLNAPPSPPPTATPAPAPPAPPAPLVVVPGPSAECLQAQKRVGKLRARLRKAEGRKQKAKLRAKLRSARAAEKRLC